MCGRKTTVAEYSVVKERPVPRAISSADWTAAETRGLGRVTCRPPPRFRATVDILRQRRVLAGHPKLALAKLRRAKDGGEYRARTGDLLVANQALSQLS